MNKSQKYLAGGIIIIAAIAFGIFIISRPRSQPVQNTQGKTTPVLADLPAPNGWYAHRINSGNIIFTREPELPAIPATESLAYGEQIDISAVPVSGSLPDWINLNVGDDVLAPVKQWGILNGHQTLQSVVTTPGDKALDFIVFDNQIAYIFSLYPYTSNNPDIEVFRKVVDAFANSK